MKYPVKLAARTTALVIAAVLVLGAAPKAHAPKRGDWNATAALTPNGHLIGNPAAQVKLAGYVSYTCSHCAQFHRQSEGPLRITYIPSGKVSMEVRHMVRDPVDLTVAMLTNCAAPARFYRLHNAFLQSQDKWIGTIDLATATQKHRWSNGTLVNRMRAIAADFGFYRTMEQHGFNRTATDRCLANQKMADRLTRQTSDARDAGVNGTPSFMIDNTLLTGTHDWQTLEPQLKARLP